MDKIPVAAVLGCPISHSRSPNLHGYWLKKHQIRGHYIPLHVEPDQLVKSIRQMPKMGFVGCNVTIPHKINTLDICDKVTDRARRIGAVNTLAFKNEKILGDNTDGYGFLAHLIQSCPGFTTEGSTVVVLGAGGAARAIVDSLIDAGANKIIVANRTLARAEELKSHFGDKVIPVTLDAVNDHLVDASLLVNTTSMGMAGTSSTELTLPNLTSQTVVYDLVYQPLVTDLLKFATSQGCKTVDGLGMLLHQAVPGFEMWFGITPEVTDDLREAVLG